MDYLRIRSRFVFPTATVIFSHHALDRLKRRKAGAIQVAAELAEMWDKTHGRRNVIACECYEVVAGFDQAREIVVVTVIYVGDKRRAKAEEIL